MRGDEGFDLGAGLAQGRPIAQADSGAGRPLARAVWLGNARTATGDPVKRDELTEKILDIKRRRDLTWNDICAQASPLSPVLTVGALLGQMRLAPATAKAVGVYLDLEPDEIKMLSEVPMRGTPMPPSDPLLYRFYELLMVNGPAWKALIEEEFGDGIMSAIDFSLELGRQIDPKGDRVRITMSGKFLPFKYYESDRDTAFAVVVD